MENLPYYVSRVKKDFKTTAKRTIDHLSRAIPYICMRVRRVVFIWPKSTHRGTAIVSLVSGYAWDDGSSDSRLFILHSFSFNAALPRPSLSLNQIHPHNFHSEPDRKNCGLATLSPREPDARSLSLGAQKCDGDLVLSRFEWKMTIVDDGYFK